ncbi:hypothetical protein BKA69DRAFT_386277 [Paraphysoderma sedebokerense]|nr:hypothetical protein BKA69DRAFT_386277 [Paraphysoderma sedebokerense]
MCGILFGCYIEHTNGTDKLSLDNSPLWNRLRELNRQRGPDSQQTYSISIPISSDTNLVLKFHSTVLHLRGDTVIAQPIFDEIHGAKTEGIDDLEKGNIGCWNGEVFGDMV